MFSIKTLLLLKIILFKCHTLMYKQHFLSIENQKRHALCFIFTIYFVSKYRIAKSYIACAIEFICTVFNVIKETPNFISGFATNSQKKFGIVKNMNRERVLLYMLFHNELFTRKCNCIQLYNTSNSCSIQDVRKSQGISKLYISTASFQSKTL